MEKDKRNIVILTGAGMSAESGVSTFRDNGGLWEEHRIEDVATPNAWRDDPELVMKFYNERRKQLFEVEPNEGHKALVKLEDKFNVQIITQNVDDLHERAGSSDVIHLHGELKKSRSSIDKDLVYDIDGWELKFGDLCEKGSQLRPHIVWFGEDVPMIVPSMKIVANADIVIVIGTSMLVYPAAGLIKYAPYYAPKYYIDPNANLNADEFGELTIIKDKAGSGVPKLVDKLLNEK